MCSTILLVPEGGKLKSAVELLEQGRALVWARLQVYQHSLEKLCQVGQVSEGLSGCYALNLRNMQYPLMLG